MSKLKTYTAAEAARRIGTTPGTFTHYARRLLGMEHRPGQAYAFTEAEIEQVRARIQEPKRQPPAPDRP